MKHSEEINHFLSVLADDMREVMNEKPTKASMLASMSFWLQTVNTIKGITK